MKLVIIEGPGKRDTLKKYLGNEYDVFATKGHVRDLPAKSIAIDIKHVSSICNSTIYLVNKLLNKINLLT